MATEETKKHLGIGSNRLCDLVREGLVPRHRIGKIWKFHRGEVDAWVRASLLVDWSPLASTSEYRDEVSTEFSKEIEDPLDDGPNICAPDDFDPESNEPLQPMDGKKWMDEQKLANAAVIWHPFLNEEDLNRHCDNLAFFEEPVTINVVEDPNHHGKEWFRGRVNGLKVRHAPSKVGSAG